jgi:hypothetical protein
LFFFEKKNQKTFAPWFLPEGAIEYRNKSVDKTATREKGRGSDTQKGPFMLKAALALFCVFAVSAAPAYAAAVAPKTLTWYDATTYIAAATKACGDKVGKLQYGKFLLAAAGKPGSQLLNQNTGNAGTPDISQIVLPVLPATNGGTSTGSAISTDLQSGTKTLNKVALTLTWGDANAFFLVAAVTRGKCVETIDLFFIHSGK